MTRTPIIAGNWKLNCTRDQAESLTRSLADFVGTGLACDVVIAPVATSLDRVASVLQGEAIGLAGQTMHWEESGAFTGELSPSLLKEVGCTDVILGHSERRQFFGETDDGVRKKIMAAASHGLRPIVCVGETLAHREAGKTLDVVLGQVDAAFDDLGSEVLGKVVVAYEPIWAIGTGKTALPSDAQEVHQAIRTRVGLSFGEAAGAGLQILYGGSVKPSNAQTLLSETDIDGALVGGASLKADTFIPIIEAGVGRAARS